MMNSTNFPRHDLVSIIILHLFVSYREYKITNLPNGIFRKYDKKEDRKWDKLIVYVHVKIMLKYNAKKILTDLESIKSTVILKD